MTEECDELRRTNELLKAENELNNGWVNNQDELREALEKAGHEKLELEQRLDMLEEKLKSLNQQPSLEKPQQKKVLDQPVSEKQHWNKKTF